MDVLLDEDETAIKDAAAEFLRARCTPKVVRESERNKSDVTARLWAEVAELGWPGLCIAEEHGGQGLPVTFMGLVLEEVGHYLAPIPLSQVAACSMILDRHGSPRQKELLRDVVSGKLRLSLCHQDRDGRWHDGGRGTVLRKDGARFVVNGVKAFVDDFARDGKCLVTCTVEGAEGRSLVLVDGSAPGVSPVELVATAKDNHVAVTFDNVRVPAGSVVGPLGGGDAIIGELLDLVALFTCCQMAGAAGKAASMAFDYAKTRHAFGQPIGAFQAIQHMSADMVIAVDGARMLAREALWRIAHGLPAQAETSQAKSFANEHSLKTCRSAQQIHGGMGFMMEFDLHLWYRRVTSWSLRAGTTAEHRRRLASVLLDIPGNVRLDRFAHVPPTASEKAAERHDKRATNPGKEVAA